MNPPLGRYDLALLGLAAIALALLAIGSALRPELVLPGWLAAFVFWSSIPIGSLVLVLIHRLVGGRWGTALAPALVPAAMLLPLAALAFVPIAVSLPALFPWRSHPVTSDVAHYYLNAPAFFLRAFLAFAGWLLLAFLVAWGRCGRLCAGLGLAFHGLIISLVSVDWMLSIDPRFTSSAFAAGFAVQQILSALAFAAVLAPEPKEDAYASDLAGLLITTLLGVVYIAFMSYLVTWYGNLPDKAGWYVERLTTSWAAVILAALIVGATVPFACLLIARVRSSRLALRILGALILIGIWLHIVWLVLPPFDRGAFIFALVATLALLALTAPASKLIQPLMRRAATHV